VTHFSKVKLANNIFSTVQASFFVEDLALTAMNVSFYSILPFNKLCKRQVLSLEKGLRDREDT
jgi:hypothetical protein